DPQRGERYRRMKKLPSAPTRAWYGENLAAIVDAIASAGARPVLGTLPMLGEDLASLPNERVRAYNDAIRAVAAAKNTALVDIYAALAPKLDPARTRRYEGSDGLMLRSIFLRHALGVP